MMKNNNIQFDPLPQIDCVVIGVNAAASLKSCLESIPNSHYPQELISIIYVDGGSHDNSISIAESLAGVQIIRLNLQHPTPGLGRNSGWSNNSAPFVQFLDSDTLLDPYWLQTGIMAFEQDIAAVMGNRLETNTTGSVFNWIANLEWNGRPGDAESFGGDVMIRRTALEETGGYDEVLVGGEDPELSRRIRLNGWRIRQMDANMTYHDLAMTTVSQYLKRAYRSGYGFAAVVDRFAHVPNSFWKKEFRRILVRGGGFLGFCVVAFAAALANLFPPYGMMAALGLLMIGFILLFFPRIFRVRYFQVDKKISYQQAKVYAWHCSIVVVPDILGVGRYYWGKLCNRPLKNRSRKIATAATERGTQDE